MSELELLLDNVEELKRVKKYEEDYQIIKQLSNDLRLIYNDNYDNDLIDKIENEIELLDNKYIELDNLVNLFDGIKFECRKKLHNEIVNKLREKNRKKNI